MPPGDNFPHPSDIGLQRGARGEGAARLNRSLQDIVCIDQEIADVNEVSEATINAIRNVQRTGGLPETGELDRPTFEFLNRPRCGPPPRAGAEPHHGKELQTIEGNPWDTSNLTYRITGTANGLSQDDTKTEIANAFRWWHNAMPALEFQEITNSGEAVHIEILFFVAGEPHPEGNNFPFEIIPPHAPQVLAHAFFPIKPIKPLGGDIHFNNNVTWNKRSSDTWDPLKDYDLATVAAHEIGHALGLDHTNDRHSVMFCIYWREHDSVPTSDGNTLQDLYAGNLTVTLKDILAEEGAGTNPSRFYAFPHLHQAVPSDPDATA